MSEATYYQRSRDLILNRVKDYYENGKERLREQAKDKCRNLSEERQKQKERIWKKNRYHNMSKEKNQNLKEYQRNYGESKKSEYNNQENMLSFSYTLLIL